jgi:hypothetical protein
VPASHTRRPTYVTECGAAWHHTPGAVAWLTKLAATLGPKRRTRAAVHQRHPVVRIPAECCAEDLLVVAIDTAGDALRHAGNDVAVLVCDAPAGGEFPAPMPRSSKVNGLSTLGLANAASPVLSGLTLR